MILVRWILLGEPVDKYPLIFSSLYGETLEEETPEAEALEETPEAEALEEETPEARLSNSPAASFAASVAAASLTASSTSPVVVPPFWRRSDRFFLPPPLIGVMGPPLTSGNRDVAAFCSIKSYRALRT